MMKLGELQRRARDIRTGPTLGDLFLEALESGWTAPQIADAVETTPANVYQGIKQARARRNRNGRA